MNAVPPAVAVPAAGWRASLALSFEAAAQRTIMRRQHNGPLLVQRAFYPEGDTCHTVLLHPPSGIVGGDTLDINIDCLSGSSALVTTPGATRFYRSDDRMAHQSITINLRGGSMEWLPMETIYFDDCNASQTAHIKLDRDSRYIGWEISCFGRGEGEIPFQKGRANVKLAIDLDGKPLLHERLKVHENTDIERLTGLRGATVSGTLLAYAAEFNLPYCLDQLRSILPADEFASTGVDGLLVVRYLGNCSEKARNGFIDAWKFIRPLALKRTACIPRIWAT